MKILALHWSTCSTAALLIDGRIEHCVSEERFSRIKNDESYPFNAINAVISAAGIHPQDIDLVAVAGNEFDPIEILVHKYSKFSVEDRLREQHQYWHPKLIEKLEPDYLKIFKDKVDVAQYPGTWDDVLNFSERTGEAQKTADPGWKTFRTSAICAHLGIDKSKVVFIDHHRAHAYYAYFAAPRRDENTLVVTADAWGDDANATLSVAGNGRFKELSRSDNFIVGRLYRYITLILGMKPDEHEYKVMGLAAYAKPAYFQKALEIFRATMQVDGIRFSYREVPPDLYFYFRDRLEGQRFDAIAGAVQQYAEETLVEWVSNALKETNCRSIRFGGGVAMNIKATLQIGMLDGVDDIFVCPSPADESLAMGAAYAAAYDVLTQSGNDPFAEIKPLDNAYLGPSCTPADINESVLLAQKDGFKVVPDPEPAHIARLLAEGKIVGRCCGNSEFGARALGNRSIIADPRQHDIIKVINEKIKSRDFWMPFAPSVLAERAEDYIVNPRSFKAPYMTMAFDTRPLAHTELRAGIHQYDQTARPQLVHREANPGYHALISQFEQATGVGAVLNTSFNIHGEPIVQTAAEAYDVFARTALDALILDGYLITND